ncbi:MAG: flagellar hook-basal body protein [Firmicutes bacterium]|nr:flagellar hook-basal body protein [Bacillota bacterium]
MRGLYNASGSMLVNQVRLENISNNISNLNTPGFKRSETLVRAFADTLLYCIENNQEGKKSSLPVGLLAQNVAIDDTIFASSDGGLNLTERKLDLALQGPGFFALETPRGVRYTRDGHFGVNGEGVLVNSQGYPVLCETGTLVLQSDQPEVDCQGNIYENGERIGRLRIVEFTEEVLRKEGYNLFQAAGDTIPVSSETTVVFQGYLEDSNTDLSRQMTDLIKVRRSYEAAQKIAQVYDRLLSRAANELGSLK